MAAFTAEDILRVLDTANDTHEFPMLDNGYIYPVDVRLSAYADEKRWAILIETLGVMPRAGDFDNSIYAFGNCLTEAKNNKSFDLYNLMPVDASEIWDAEPDEDEWVEEDPDDERWQCDLPVRRDATEVMIRGRAAHIPDPNEYAARDVHLEHPPHVQFHELMRFLADDYRSLLVATEDELRQYIPSDLPLLLRLDAWWHPDTCNGEKPSESETFQMIANALVACDRSKYKAPKETNTHWSNWPDGGTM